AYRKVCRISTLERTPTSPSVAASQRSAAARPATLRCSRKARSTLALLATPRAFIASSSPERSGARAADRFDDETPVLEEAVEHAPGKRTVRAAALQSQAHAWPGLRIAHCSRRSLVQATTWCSAIWR